MFRVFLFGPYMQGPKQNTRNISHKWMGTEVLHPNKQQAHQVSRANASEDDNGDDGDAAARLLEDSSFDVVESSAVTGTMLK